MVLDLLAPFAAQLQKPTLAFLFGGMALAALGSRLEIPEPVYRFIVVLLMLKIGLGAGISLREANPAEIALPALIAVVLGIAIVLLGRVTLARAPGIAPADGMATAGLFGAVSASTLAAAMVMLEADDMTYEAWVPALYPFMDIPALLTAIVLAQMARGGTVRIGAILADSARGAAVSALGLGLVLGIVARPDAVHAEFYEPLFRGLLTILMLVMGMEAWSRLAELRHSAHAHAAYALTAPLVHGALGFGLGYGAHLATGFSAGGVVLLAVMAASSSDISGPPTLRAAIPQANPAAYLGASTSLGTPMALLTIPLWMALAQVVM
ncbi:sodium-dependent bicarbonate transport family permease [Rhodobaculum claviforme]|uniref:Sodium-dependent bicarbonate transport family permease n=1 Tax=Rhodobaculum claviforme TaxID=1549854 RepID=A0A934TKK8_9RHOB|nr:sodium-dependent bicarbonate transport family permease [Rhodobaculum claviforme]MBK5927505.1 sodium-dependent bicarbonate transport family permease [Rhodobaculum claviforme]